MTTLGGTTAEQDDARSARLGTLLERYGTGYRPDWTPETRLIPRRVVIETMFGCNARCAMCIVGEPTERPKGAMSMELYRSIIDRLRPHVGQVQMFDLFGLGEPLLDQHLFERIQYTRQVGFRRLAFSTNCHLLTPDKQQQILDSGIETVIFSIDGIRKETLEAIRPRTSFERVMRYTQELIERRNAGNYATRFVVRFVRQRSNADEWDEYCAFWKQRIAEERGDLVYCYDAHTWSGQVNDGRYVDAGDRDPAIDVTPCHHIFEKLVILANGEVSLCFEDILEGQFGFGNVQTADPIDIFNGPRFQKIRKLHVDGKKTNLNICRDCRVLYHEPRRS